MPHDGGIVLLLWRCRGIGCQSRCQ